MRNEKNNKLSINDLPQKIPDFKNSELSKDKLTAKWLSEWIISEKKNKNIKSGDILPSKKVIANYLGISSGTVENALRYLEDDGLIGSKQRIGTYITDKNNTLKQNSKRDIAINYLKKYISEHEIGYTMPPVKVMSKETDIAHNTLRLAYIFLISQGILIYSKNKKGKKIIIVQKLPENIQIDEIQKNSLVEKTTDILSAYIKSNCQKGERIPSRDELSKLFNVSVKTIHDSIKILEEKSILISKRGKYGTIVINFPGEENPLQQGNEYSIFAKSKLATKYRWEKTENRIKTLIREYYEQGSKLPSMSSLAKNFDVSTNTIRLALKKLAEEGWVEFSRGRYGGTFVVYIPDMEEQSSYEWIAVAKNYEDKKSSI